MSIYIQPLGCKRKGSSFDLTFPLLAVGNRSVMNQTTNKPPLPQPIPWVQTAASCCQLQLPQPQEWLSLVTLRSFSLRFLLQSPPGCDAQVGFWTHPAFPFSNQGFGRLLLPAAELSSASEEKAMEAQDG